MVNFSPLTIYLVTVLDFGSAVNEFDKKFTKSGVFLLEKIISNLF